MLMPREEQVQARLPAKRAGGVLAAVIQNFPCRGVFLKTAVVDTDRHVAAPPQSAQHPAGRGQRFFNAELTDRFLPLPSRQGVRAQPEHADAQPVLQRKDPALLHRQNTRPAADIGA